MEQRNNKILLLGIIFAFSFIAGFVTREHVPSRNTVQDTITSNELADVDLAPVWKAWKILDEKFVPATTTKAYTEQDHVWGMIEGLADSYNDPYTTFFPPQENKSFTEEISGHFGGIGIEMGIRDGLLTVIAPLKGTPAEEAGLLSGDFIVEVDGVSTQNISTDDAVEMIRGEIGDIVTLTIARKGEKEFVEVPIERQIIDIPTLDSTLRDDGIFVISLYNFGATATHEMRLALRQFIHSGSTKMVLDLRNNPGGYLEVAVEIASWFLPIGKTVVIEDYGTQEAQRILKTKGTQVIDDTISIVVLIDGGSASASEILAGALHEHGRATLIGENTFGKGSVQELINVTDTTSLKITVARWLTPNGNSISEVGLKPDYEVTRTIEDYENDIDPHLDGAIRYLLTNEAPLPSATSSQNEKVEDTEEIE